jgi:hypothetical protein
LDFVGATSLDAGITFSRGSQATLFDSAGTLVYAKHNLLTYSEDFANAAWTKSTGSITSNTVVAPDGTLTGDKFIPDNGASGAYVAQGFTSVSGTTYTYTVYAKSSELTSFRILAESGIFGSNQTGNYDLSTGMATVISGTPTVSMTPVGNGWYRCVLTAAATAAATGAFQQRFPNAGDGTSGLFFWGAQLNLAGMEGGVTSSLATYYPTTTAAYYAPRFDYNPSTLAAQGLLIEEQRTNSIRNNTMQGAVVPSTAPTNWSLAASGTGTFTVVGTGTENGITYIEIQLADTAAAQSSILFEATTQVVAADTQTWTNSFYFRRVSGGTTVTYENRIVFRTAAGAGVTTQNVVFSPSTSSISTQRYSNTFTAANATIARVTGQIALTTSGADTFTFRIGLPQLEQGAFATSVIPTTTTALTRNADVASMTGTNFSSWYNASEGTLYVDAARGADVDSTIATIAVGATTADRIQIHSATASEYRVTYRTGNVEQAALVMSSSTNAPKIAATIKTNDLAASINGGAAVTDTSATLATYDTLYIGARSDSAIYWNGTIRRIAYYPVRLPNSTLQALTA